LPRLTNDSPLSFPLALTDGKILATIGDSAACFSNLTAEQREKNYWQIAIRMLNHALHEPNYLKAATLSLQTAFVLEGTLASPSPLNNH
jgi:hypothetical protein